MFKGNKEEENKQKINIGTKRTNNSKYQEKNKKPKNK